MGLIQREQVAGMNCHYYRYSLDYFFTAQQRAGFTTVALWGGAPHFYLDHLGYNDCQAIRRKAQSHGLAIRCFTAPSCTYGYQMGMQPIAQNKRSLNYFKKGIQAAAELGCSMMVTNSGWGYWNEPQQDAWARSREMLWQLSEEAQRAGIVLTMESLRYAESHLVYRLEDAIRMHREVNHPALKMMIDTTAAGVAGETPEQWLEAFGADLVNTHFIDGTPYGHLVWGDGRFPLAEYLHSLERHGYTGLLGLEVTDSRYYNDPAEADTRNMQILERFF